MSWLQCFVEVIIPCGPVSTENRPGQQAFGKQVRFLSSSFSRQDRIHLPISSFWWYASEFQFRHRLLLRKNLRNERGWDCSGTVIIQVLYFSTRFWIALGPCKIWLLKKTFCTRRLSLHVPVRGKRVVLMQWETTHERDTCSKAWKYTWSPCPERKRKCNPEQAIKTVTRGILGSNCNLSFKGQQRSGGFICKGSTGVEVVSMWQSQEQETAGLETLISPKAFCRVHCFFWIPGAATCLFQVLNKDVLNEFSGRNCLPYPTCCYCGEMLAGKLFCTECKAYVVCSLFRHTSPAFACPMAGGAALLNLPELQPSTIPGVGPESRSQLLGEQVGGKSSQQLWQNCTVA